MPTGTDAFPRLNQEGRIVGFGVINQTSMTDNPAPNAFLKTVYLTVRSSATCNTSYPKVDFERNFCANDDHLDSTNVCKGDSGTAFVVTVRGQKVLVR